MGLHVDVGEIYREAARLEAERLINIEKEKAQAELLEQQNQIYSEIQTQKTDAENLISSKARELDNQYQGFLTGAVAPAYKTSMAGVTIRDSWFGYPNVVPTATQKKVEFPWWLVAVGIITFYFAQKRK